ncbi:flavodoxin family protein [Mailhella massiliensis]|uniref:Flavodoxin family protein n=1 Tax=Mailhella massiliensis TaxID=1903261 RepID=A0A921AV45_9BACT|nr:flavodoxin family protein [Mailhella massiliensis]HJD96382.1 flavodoxin family protein [Mailhella massiliensis]
MKALAFNCSPRKQPWTTATLLEKALEGAASQGAETRLYHMFDYTFTGCRSCYLCKRLGHENDAKCFLKDDLTPILEDARDADLLFLGSPIYYYAETGCFRNLFERLLYPWSVMTAGTRTQFPRIINTALFYSMNLREDQIGERESPPYPEHFRLEVMEKSQFFMARTFGCCEVFLCTETQQVKDFSKYRMSVREPEARIRRRKEVFPEDCRRAFELGARLAANPPVERQLAWQRDERAAMLVHG